MASTYSPIDETVIVGCINKNRNSQRQLYNLLSPSLYSLILREGFDQKEAEEVLERVFIDIFGSIAAYNCKTSFQAWYLKKYKESLSAVAKDDAGSAKIISLKYKDPYLK